MCYLLESLNIYLNVESRKAKRLGHAYTWDVMETKPCQRPKCPETRQLRMLLVDLLESRIQVAINPKTSKPFVEKNFVSEASEFSELLRISQSQELPRAKKIDLISKPSRDAITRFVTVFCDETEVSSEVLVFGVILLKRLLEATSWSLRASNWRIFLITAMRLAAKCEEATTLSGKLLTKIYPLFGAEEFVHLEAMFLKLISYKCFISYEQYAEELQSLFHVNIPGAAQ
mmetsp:Transcript_34054/g.38689  ORF Transcript_34054/g.38689 Transcript_34054/m.38689 type:complete len:230 (-) Transcript_34054:527-1216(-)